MAPHRFPDEIGEVVLDGRHLALDEVVAVARYRARVRLDDAARRRVDLSRAVVSRLIKDGAKVYGLTTGFGSKRDSLIEPEELARLQTNLIQSHACGVGDALAEDEVRAAILLRANTLSRGNSGVRSRVIDALLDFLNHDVYPWVPSRGSLGASGDLAPLSHLALALINDPAARFYRCSPEEPAPSALEGVGTKAPDFVARPVEWQFREAPPELFGGSSPLTPLVLEAKEGLAVNNGTQVSTAIGLLSAFDSRVLLDSGELVASLSLEANKAVIDAFDPRLHEARPLPGQSEVADHILSFVEGSEILRIPLNTARLHRARRSLVAARDELDRSSKGTGALVTRAEQSIALVESLEADVRTIVTMGPAGSDLGRGARREAQKSYREVLDPIRSDVLSLYAEVLDAPLTGDAIKGRDFLADAVSQLQLALPERPNVQDDYSFRCTPQVLGAVRAAVDGVIGTLEIEANSATDNPLVFPPRVDSFAGTPAEYEASLNEAECIDAVVSGGNFHGEPVAIELDRLGIAMAELANVAERRTAHLVDGHLSNGLPSLLVYNSGLNNGLMIPQYVAASLVSENKVLAHPASVDSIPSCENTEDHVSMSALAALKLRQIVRNAETVVSIELMTAWQGVSFRRPLSCGRGTERLWCAVEDAGMTPVRSDRVLYRDMEMILEFLRGGGVWRIALDTRRA